MEKMLKIKASFKNYLCYKIYYSFIFYSNKIVAVSQEYPIVERNKYEKDTVCSLIDISLINGKVFDHYENGIIKLLIEFKDGIKNGDYKKWHSNGQLIYKGSYSKWYPRWSFWKRFDVFGKKISKTKFKTVLFYRQKILLIVKLLFMCSLINNT